jgi:hypothetical protein
MIIFRVKVSIAWKLFFIIKLDTKFHIFSSTKILKMLKIPPPILGFNSLETFCVTLTLPTLCVKINMYNTVVVRLNGQVARKASGQKFLQMCV